MNRKILAACILSFVSLAAKAQMTLPMVITDRGSLLVDVAINGKLRHVLWDTGAERTTMSSKSILDIRHDRCTFAVGINGKTSVCQTNPLLFNDLNRSMAVFTTDLSAMQTNFTSQLDGILGQDFMRSFSAIKVDYKRREIVLYE
jgi:hypothetical protein